MCNIINQNGVQVKSADLAESLEEDKEYFKGYSGLGFWRYIPNDASME